MRTLTLIIAPEDDGRRFDRVARGRLGVAEKQLRRAKYAGGLKLDGEVVHADRAVRAGQCLSVDIEDDGPGFALRPAFDVVNIVYEDEDLYIVDKPAPLATQSSPGRADDALENRLAGHFGETGFVFRPVNRLDRGTSGLMTAAKNAHAQAKLNEALHTPDFVRGYLAVVDGAPEPPSGIVDAPIGHVEGENVRREVRPDGKSAVTHYETLAARDSRALVRLRLETGRTHQIRVHMAHLGCPVSGDYLYGTPRDDLPGRFALHSAYLRFTHPVTGRVLTFESPMPEAFGSWDVP